MRLNFLLRIMLCVIVAAPLWAGAQGKDGQPDVPPGAVFRYEREDGSTAISSSLPDEAIEQGYEVLNRNGRVIRTVEPALTKKERRQLKEKKERKRERKKQQKRDEKLLRLYAGPGDARRARDRQIEALEVNISYARNSLQGVKQKLDREVSNAAKYERRGEKVPKSVRDSIDHFQSQIEEYKKEIEQYKKDIQDVREKYRPIIERLKVIAPEGQSGSPNGDTGQGEQGASPSGGA
jgi:hypothetical protein